MNDRRKPERAALLDVTNTIVVLGADRSALPSPGGAEFWDALMAGKRPDVEAGWLVSSATSEGAWPHWEMHPEGEEIVMLLAGAATLFLEHDGVERPHLLERVGQLVVIPRGTWHRLDSEQTVTLLFVTAGKGTQHRPLAR